MSRPTLKLEFDANCHGFCGRFQACGFLEEHLVQNSFRFILKWVLGISKKPRSPISPMPFRSENHRRSLDIRFSEASF